MSSRSDLISALDRALWSTDARAAVLLQVMADQAGLHSTDLECLTILVHGGPLTAGQLADRIGLTTGAATRLIDRLVQAGYTRRSADPADRRRVIVEVVPDRVQAIIALYEPMSQAIATIAEPYDNRTLVLFAEFLTASHLAMQQEIVRLRDQAQQAAAGTIDVAVPLTHLTELKLLLRSGARMLTIKADGSIGDAFRARFKGSQPRVDIRHDTIDLKFGGSPVPWHSSMAQLSLNPTIAWHLIVRNGISKFDADLRELTIRSIEMKNGVSDASITLPMPVGAVPIQIKDGLSNLTIRRPADAAMRIHLAGGVTNVTLDGERLPDNELRWETPGFAAASDRFDVTIKGGASNVAFDTR